MMKMKLTLCNSNEQSPNDFTVILPKGIDLTQQDWTVSLARIIIYNADKKLSKEPVFIHCSLCEPSPFFHGTLLDVVILPEEQVMFPHPLQCLVVKEIVNSIRIRLLLENGKLLSTLPANAKLIVVLELLEIAK